MWTFRNLVALGLFLFGTTFLWMTAAQPTRHLASACGLWPTNEAGP
jgi:hypothetical protein